MSHIAGIFSRRAPKGIRPEIEKVLKAFDAATQAAIEKEKKKK